MDVSAAQADVPVSALENGPWCGLHVWKAGGSSAGSPSGRSRRTCDGAPQPSHAHVLFFAIK